VGYDQAYSGHQYLLLVGLADPSYATTLGVAICVKKKE
jgi:hypothetical protein